MKNIAHRGYAGLYPENTLAAFRKATDGGKHAVADMVEIDIQPCRDGGIIVFHDERLRKHGRRGLTDRKGVPWKTDCGELREARIMGTGETIPTLEQVMEVVPDSVSVNIEFKDIDSEDVQFSWGTEDVELGLALEESELEKRKQIWLDFAEQTLETASRFENDILVSSFFEGAIAAAREVDPNVPAAFLFWNSIDDGLKVTRRHDCEAVHPPIDMIKGRFFNSKTYTVNEFKDIDLVEEMHNEGREVNVWTINNWHQAREMRKANADGLISNYPPGLFFE